jgi:hypothetical protein
VTEKDASSRKGALYIYEKKIVILLGATIKNCEKQTGGLRVRRFDLGKERA